MGTIKCIGILTSGGDAPGMNAAIRAVTPSRFSNTKLLAALFHGNFAFLLLF